MFCFQCFSLEVIFCLVSVEVRLSFCSEGLIWLRIYFKFEISLRNVGGAEGVLFLISRV